MAGRSTVALKAEQLGLGLDDAVLGDIVEQLKELEHRGFHFEVADGSLELLMRSATGWKQPFFSLESHRVITELREDGAFVTEATVKVIVGDDRVMATAEGNGPVNALDAALRKAIGPVYPDLAHIHLTDFKVRVLDTSRGHRRGDPGADRLDRRRARLDDHRRLGQRDRGVLGRPGGFGRVRVAPRRSAAQPQQCPAMTQPPHVPLQDADRVRPSSLLPPPRPWYQQRPGEWHGPWRPQGPASGLPDRTSATVSSWPTASRTGCGCAGRHREDALYGGFVCGGRRAAEFGRAPVIHDMEWAYTLWGYLGGGAGRSGRLAGRAVPRRGRGLLGAAPDRRRRSARDPPVDAGPGAGAPGLVEGSGHRMSGGGGP